MLRVCKKESNKPFQNIERIKTFGWLLFKVINKSFNLHPPQKIRLTLFLFPLVLPLYANYVILIFTEKNE